MVDEFTVSPSALRDDAATWTQWQSSLDSIRGGVPSVDILAFSILPGAVTVAGAYLGASQTFVEQLGVGVKQLTGVADTLRWSADRYAEMESTNQQTIATAAEEG
ncbi:hypothetical protein [Microbacterium sp. che218]|uniref:hypothetical protein n=1 Tax=Microbacterium sp. che218 TaxID=3140649 RepID=UPI00336631CE